MKYHVWRLPIQCFNGYPDFPEEVFSLIPQVPIKPQEGDHIEMDQKMFPTASIGFIEKVEFPASGGILMFSHPMKVPTRGIIIPEALQAADVVKKYIKSWLSFFGGKMRYFLFPLFVVPQSLFNRIAWKWIEMTADFVESVVLHFAFNFPIVLKPKYLSPAVAELYRVGDSQFGYTREGKIIVTFLCLALENDRNYRYRVQDILGDIDGIEIKIHSRKEIARLVKLLMTRDRARGWSYLENVIKLVLWFRPQMTKMIVAFLWELDMMKIQLDAQDMYFCLNDAHYDYLGLSYEERQKKFETLKVGENGVVSESHATTEGDEQGDTKEKLS